ncbi:MAG TPA: response regulator [Anaerohalosphaeraceae bacterium]|nr:response regulator [Anaerohalosphaeraceae bacterium]HPB92423.1 response regulator [Anaerohalosphaeraceae bacterium]HRT23134.1 response regulator [Anaerohalosphaeraceae bacterium]HRU14545.1 response regulator [Anaerohalosphaeraceae bacterium]
MNSKSRLGKTAFFVDRPKHLPKIEYMSYAVLVVDDQPDLLELLELSLQQQGYRVRTALSGQEALRQIENEPPDLILLDILLGDISGIQLTARLKNSEKTAAIPIILLTAKDTETDIIVGLSVGADDYITKPFSMQVLLARMEAVLRRSRPSPSNVQEILTAGSVRLFPAGRQVFVEGKPVELTPAEFNILTELIRAAGAVRSREELLKAAGPSQAGENERIVDVHIAALRKKLGPARNLVKTVHGRGYRASV